MVTAIVSPSARPRPSRIAPIRPERPYRSTAIRVVSQEKYDSWLLAAATNLGDANKALMASVDRADKSVLVADNVSK